MVLREWATVLDLEHSCEGRSVWMKVLECVVVQLRLLPVTDRCDCMTSTRSSHCKKFCSGGSGCVNFWFG